MAIREVQGRWYLYTGHFWDSGWSVVDVTDPTAPEVLTFVAGPANTATLQVDLAGDTMVTVPCEDPNADRRSRWREVARHARAGDGRDGR